GVRSLDAVAADLDVLLLRRVPGELGGAVGAVGLDVDDHVLDGVGGLAVQLGDGLVGGAEVGTVAVDVDVRVVDDLRRLGPAQGLLQLEQIESVEVGGGARGALVAVGVLIVQAVLDVHTGDGAAGGRRVARAVHDPAAFVRVVLAGVRVDRGKGL